MSLRRQVSVRAIGVYLVASVTAWILTSGVWGATGGVVFGLSIARNPEYQQRVNSFLRAKGITSDPTRTDTRNAYERLSEEDQEQFTRMTRDALAALNWFVITLFVSAAVFGLVGFIGGLVARAWVLAAAVPALSLISHNTVIRYPMAKDLPTEQKVFVVIVGQFVVCCLFAYFGARLAAKRMEKKQLANQAL